MDYGSRHSSPLPSTGVGEGSHIQRQDADAHAKQHSTTSSLAEMRPSVTSSYHRPPSPSNHPQATSNRSFSGPLSPVSMRRRSEDEREQHPAQRLSLPSIHEALGTSQPTSHPSQYPNQSYQPPPPPPPPALIHSHPPNSPHNLSKPLNREPYTTLAYSQQHQPSPALPAAYSSTPSYLRRPTPPPPPSSANSRGPSLHPITTSHSPKLHDGRPAQWNGPHKSSADQPVSGPTSATSQHYSQPYPPSTHPSTPASQYESDPYRHSSTWRAGGRVYEAATNGNSDSAGSNIGDSVKRHLEVFDLEASLNEISDGSKQLHDFSVYYGQRAHETQRSGPLPGSTPHLSEIDKMMRQGIRIQESLGKLREVVATQQAELVERSKEQIPKQVNGHMNGLPPRNDSIGGGGFGGADPKKRRGRAAPPGNCHSCNRSETPEWRRGPDGARTLCNACGLHYAKLTRKMGVSKATITSSSLRPKDV